MPSCDSSQVRSSIASRLGETIKSAGRALHQRLAAFPGLPDLVAHCSVNAARGVVDDGLKLAEVHATLAPPAGVNVG